MAHKIQVGLSREDYDRTQRIADEQRRHTAGIRAAYRRLLRHLIGKHPYNPIECVICAEVADELTKE